MRKLPLLIVAICLGSMGTGVSGTGAQGPPGGDPPGKRPPKVKFDEEMTPLQKEIERVIEKRKNENKGAPGAKKKCSKGGPGKKCEEALPCADCGDLNAGGKMKGKRLRTQTVLDYAEPGQRGKASWDRIMLRGRTPADIGDLRGTGSSRGIGSARVQSAFDFTRRALNNDRDCIDRVTGLVHREAECFVAADSDELIANLAEPDPVDGTCTHDSGEVLFGNAEDFLEDVCYDADNVFKATSLEPLIDEDGPEGLDNDEDGFFDEDPADGINNDRDCIFDDGVDSVALRGPDCFDESGALLPDRVERVDEDGPDGGLSAGVDQDGDGLVDEDPAEDQGEAACTDLLGEGLGDPTPDGGCDLTRAVIVAVNNKTMAMSGKKVFLADDTGNPIPPDMGKPELKDAKPYGEEAREVTLTETFTVKCKGKDFELVDGVCVKEVPAAAAATRATGGGAAATAATASSSHEAMMGFTFAPPVIEWGYKIEEKACVLGVCAEILFARVGYEFDVAAGLRLPVSLSVENIPDPHIRAEQDIRLATSIEPLDFTVKQYKEFCQRHELHKEPFIASCDRFAFEEFLHAQVEDGPNDLLDVLGIERDGAEFVAQETVFAGVVVRVLGATVINWAIDSSIDLPAACTMNQIVEKIKSGEVDFTLFDLAKAMQDENATRKLLELLKDEIPNCQSFTTPFGSEDGEPRTFPFLEGTSIEIPAGCADADSVTVKGKALKICTGLVLGSHGAGLGIGLGLDIKASSNLISADWRVGGDAQATGGTELEYCEEGPISPCSPAVELKAKAENFADTGDGRPDEAVFVIDDLTYFLNEIEMILNANLQFTGILSPIPDLASFEVFTLAFDVGDAGIPIGQHAGTEPVRIPVFVENYGLGLEVRADQGGEVRCVDTPEGRADPPCWVGPSTLRVKPGELGTYALPILNIGSLAGSFDNVRVSFSNRLLDLPPSDPLRCASYDVFDIGDGDPDGFDVDPDTDGDGAIDEDTSTDVDDDGDGFRGEDPPDAWSTNPADTGGLTVRAEAHASTGANSLTVQVSPFRHPLTAPGIYPFSVQADSVEAKQDPPLGPVDASDNPRIDACAVGFIEVVGFYEPYLRVVPETGTAAKPGVLQSLDLEIGNRSNVTDEVGRATTFVDFNLTGRCTLTTLGTLASCPYRAVPTAIPPAWTTIAAIPDRFGPLAPLRLEIHRLTVLPPPDWAGMQDTAYEVFTEVTSLGDPATPAASKEQTVTVTVVATLMSMTNYIGLEIDELIAKIQAANDAGIKTGGLKPILLHPATMKNDRARDYVAAGDLEAARRTHESNIKIVEAFLYALSGGGKSLPADLAADWRAAAEAIVRDQTAASGSDVAPALCQVNDLVVSGAADAGPRTYRSCRSITWTSGPFDDVTGIAPTQGFAEGFWAGGSSAWRASEP